LSQIFILESLNIAIVSISTITSLLSAIPEKSRGLGYIYPHKA